MTKKQQLQEINRLNKEISRASLRGSDTVNRFYRKKPEELTETERATALHALTSLHAALQRTGKLQTA